MLLDLPTYRLLLVLSSTAVFGVSVVTMVLYLVARKRMNGNGPAAISPMAAGLGMIGGMFAMAGVAASNLLLYGNRAAWNVTDIIDPVTVGAFAAAGVALIRSLARRIGAKEVHKLHELREGEAP